MCENVTHNSFSRQCDGKRLGLEHSRQSTYDTLQSGRSIHLKSTCIGHSASSKAIYLKIAPVQKST